jgi:hypothetical protein
VSKITQIEGLLRSYYIGEGMDEQKSTSAAKAAVGSIRNLGGISDELIAELTVDDLSSFLPVLVARRVLKLVGNNVDPLQTRQIVVMDDNPVSMAARLKPEELVAEYDPNDPTNPFGERLKSLSKGHPFLVFKPGQNSHDIPASARLLRELLDNYPPRKATIVDGMLTELYSVGNRPARYADENPAFHGNMLRPDGTSDAYVNWSVLPLKVRQLVWIAVSLGEISNRKEVDTFSDVNGKSEAELAQRFPRATLEYTRLEGMQSLPSLKIPLVGAPPKEAIAPAAPPTPK